MKTGSRVTKTASALMLGSAASVVCLLPQTATAAPCAYPAKQATSTALSMSATVVAVHGSAIATVTVSSGTGTPTGSVKLRVGGHPAMTLLLSGGSASHSVPAAKPGTYSVHASYAGTCRYAGSQASTSYTIKGTQILGRSANRGDNRPATAVLGTSARLRPSSGVLAPTGLDNRTELAGLGGLALVALGAAGVAVGRRRSPG